MPRSARELAALSHDAILSLVEREMAKEATKILAPLVRGRKGIYRDLFLRLRKMGFHTVRVDGQWMDLALVPALERHREHDIEVLIPYGAVASTETTDLSQVVRKALGLGGGTLHLAGEETRVLSDRLYCPDCNRGLAPLDPRLFSFNSNWGMPHLHGARHRPGDQRGSTAGSSAPEPSGGTVGVSRYLDLSGKISVLGGAASRVLDSRPSFGPGTARGRAGAGYETGHASRPRERFPGLLPILRKEFDPIEKSSDGPCLPTMKT